MLLRRVRSFMRLFPEFSCVVFIYYVKATMCSTSERNGEPVSIHLLLCGHRAMGSEFLQGCHYPIHENRKDNSGPRRKSSCNWQSWLSLLCSVSAVLLPFPDPPPTHPRCLLPNQLLQAPALRPSELQERSEEMVALKRRIPL